MRSEINNQLISLDTFRVYTNSPEMQISANILMGQIDPNHEFDTWHNVFIPIVENAAAELGTQADRHLISKGYMVMNETAQNRYKGYVMISSLSHGLLKENLEKNIDDFLNIEKRAKINIKRISANQQQVYPNQINMIPTFYMIGQLDYVSVLTGELENLEEFNPEILKHRGCVHTDGPFAKYFPGKFNSDDMMKVIPNHKEIYGK